MQNQSHVAKLTYNGWLKVNKHSTRNVLSCTSFAEEGVEGVVASADGLVRGHLTVWLDPVFQAVQLPAGIANLNTGLSDMN